MPADYDSMIIANRFVDFVFYLVNKQYHWQCNRNRYTTMYMQIEYAFDERNVFLCIL